MIMFICILNNLQNVCVNQENNYKPNSVMIHKFVEIHKVSQMYVDVCTYSFLIILYECVHIGSYTRTHTCICVPVRVNIQLCI